MALKHLLLVDDDESIIDYLRRGLVYEGFSVQVASSGEVGLALARERIPDLVILDWMLPGLNGIEVLERLKAVDRHLPVIMLTAKDTPANQVEGFETGADDYVVKPVRFEVLLARIRARLRSQEISQPSILRFADLRMDPTAHSVFRGEREIQLTALEFRLLQLFMENPGRVFSKPIILDRVWGEDFFGDTNVVEVYVMQLRQKLEAATELRLIQNIRGVGYILRESEAN